MSRFKRSMCRCRLAITAGVPRDFAVPAVFDGVVVEGLTIGELVLKCGQELGAGRAADDGIAALRVRRGR